MSLYSFEESEFILRIKAKKQSGPFDDGWDDDFDDFYHAVSESEYYEPVDEQALEKEDALNNHWDRVHDQDRRAALKRRVFGP